LPSQALFVSVAFEHVAPHTVVAPGYVHAEPLVPSHAPAHIPIPSHALRIPCGASMTEKQCPKCPATSHAWHCPLHELSQHTPSMQ
jgi:hypothetical protein